LHRLLHLSSQAVGRSIDGYEFLPAVGTRGGILLTENSDYIEASNVQCRNYSLTMEIKIRMNNSAFQLTIVYGPTDDSEKEAFLAQLPSSKPSASSSWIVLGDFNLIYEARDKNHLNLNRRLMGRFSHVLDSCELFEFALQNRNLHGAMIYKTPPWFVWTVYSAIRNGTLCIQASVSMPFLHPYLTIAHLCPANNASQG
jgi:hypothetical protein